MRESWKYFAVRTIDMLLAVMIIALIISAFFVTFREENQEEAIQRQVKGEIKNIDFEDPDEAYEYREERIHELREENDLDGPRAERILDNAVDMITFKFGRTERLTTPGRERNQQINEVIMAYLPYTILLFTTAAAIYTVLAIFVGLKTAQMAGSSIDKFLTVVSASLSSAPLWWTGMIFMLIFSAELGWYPTPEPTFPTVRSLGYLGYMKELLIKMSLPLFTIVIVKFGGRLLVSRNLVTRILEEDYIIAARAKGLPERKIIYGHVLKTASPPIMTTAVLALLTSLGGALIAEVVFQWPGIGYLLRRALYEPLPHSGETATFEDRLIISITFVLVVISVVGLYITDMIYGYLDPRVSVGSKFGEGKR
ncbi:MAG: ABC transporter permease [Candidatus Natronoplasma sp.]